MIAISTSAGKEFALCGAGISVGFFLEVDQPQLDVLSVCRVKRDKTQSCEVSIDPLLIGLLHLIFLRIYLLQIFVRDRRRAKYYLPS